MTTWLEHVKNVKKQNGGLQLKDNSNPNGDIAIKMIGVRPGEKLYEELLISNNPQATKHPKIFKSSDPYIEWSKLKPKIDTLQKWPLF